MKRHFFQFNLRSQLMTVMLLMMIISMGSLIYLQKITEDKIFTLIQEEITGLTEAMEISVEQITAKGSTNEARLKSYYEQLNKRGIEEVSILSESQEVIESTNPKMIGSRVSVAKNELLIMQKIGDANDGGQKKIYKAFVPVLSEGNLKGYIHVSMYFDDLDKISREMFYKRAAWMIPVFGMGVLLCIIISYRYTRPISVLIEAMRSITQGKTPALPSIPQAEIGNLAESLKNMVIKLEEQKVMEKRLKQIEHQAILAQLASGIAHEIRNPLNFISLSIDHLSTFKSLKEDKRENPLGLLKKVKTEIGRVNQMVMNFLDLGREMILYPIRLRADLSVENVLELCCLILRDRNITVTKDYCEPMPEVEIDIDKMKSCFLNLINNAADSMVKGGLLKISIIPQNGFVIYLFEDTGEGIEPEDLPKIYEPYFTTKKTGTGIGLAIAKRVVDAHGGEINIESNPGEGTKVRVAIPMAERIKNEVEDTYR